MKQGQTVICNSCILILFLIDQRHQQPLSTLFVPDATTCYRVCRQNSVFLLIFFLFLRLHNVVHSGKKSDKSPKNVFKGISSLHHCRPPPSPVSKCHTTHPCIISTGLNKAPQRARTHIQQERNKTEVTCSKKKTAPCSTLLEV